MDPEFERAFIAMLYWLGEEVEPLRFADSPDPLVRKVASGDRTARAHLMAMELLRLRIGLERMTLS